MWFISVLPVLIQYIHAIIGYNRKLRNSQHIVMRMAGIKSIDIISLFCIMSKRKVRPYVSLIKLGYQYVSEQRTD